MINLWALLVVTITQTPNTVDVDVTIEVYDSLKKCLTHKSEVNPGGEMENRKVSAACVQRQVQIN